MSEEHEFEVIDKRGTRPDAEPAGQPSADSAAKPQGESGGISAEELQAAMEEAAQAMEDAGGMGMGMPELDVPGALRFCLQMLQEVAWMKLGLVASPGSGKIDQDLPQAKVAIDAVGDLVGRLNAFAEESERRDLQTILSNLRINFVQKSQGG